MEKVKCIMLNRLHSCQKRSGRRTAADWLIGARCYITGWLLFKGVQRRANVYPTDAKILIFIRRYCVHQHGLVKLIRRSHDRGAWVFSYNLQASQADFRSLDFSCGWKVVSQGEKEVAAQCHLLCAVGSLCRFWVILGGWRKKIGPGVSTKNTKCFTYRARGLYNHAEH